jgi:hypothetical protein
VNSPRSTRMRSEGRTTAQLAILANNKISPVFLVSANSTRLADFY